MIKFIGTYFLSIRDGYMNFLFSEYTNWPSVCLSIAIFILFKYIDWEKFSIINKTSKIVSKVSGGAFGVYLIHMYIINFFYYNLNINEYSFTWRFLGPPVIYTISCLIVLCLKKYLLYKNVFRKQRK